MNRLAVLAVLLAGCGQGDRAASATSPGAALEAAAIEAGLVADPDRASLIGSWARESDRVCIVPGDGGRERVGILLDYGAGNGCVASGAIQRASGRLDVTLPNCRIEARFDGERITFPATVESGCARYCSGNATMAAITVELVSPALSEAATLRAPSGRLLCAG